MLTGRREARLLKRDILRPVVRVFAAGRPRTKHSDDHLPTFMRASVAVLPDEAEVRRELTPQELARTYLPVIAASALGRPSGALVATPIDRTGDPAYHGKRLPQGEDDT